MFERLQAAVLIRNGVSIRDDRSASLLLKLLVAMGVRDRARRIHLDRTSDRVTLNVEGDGWHNEMIPPPPLLADELCRFVATEPQPWYRRLMPRFRREPLVSIPETWHGRIEVRIEGLVVSAQCEALAHPDGFFIALDPTAVDDEVRARLGLLFE